jgi:D-amino peptidase
VPVGLVTGDQQACAQAAAALGPGGTDVAIVKQAGGRSQATSLHPQVACERIEAAAAAAVARRDLKPFTPPSPYTLAIDFMQTAMAEMAALAPGAERTGPRRVTYRSDNIAEIARCRVALTTLAASVHQRP